MAEFPYIKLWVNDFLGKTLHLDATETGAYLMLLISAWQTKDCSIPDNPRDLARLARCTPKVWRRVRARVMAYWTMCPDGRWRQPRLCQEFLLVSQRSLVRAAARRGKSLKLNGAKLTFDEVLSIICAHSHSQRSKKEALQEGSIGPEERLRLISSKAGP